MRYQKIVAFFFFLSITILNPCLGQSKEAPPLDSATKDYKYEEVVQVKDNAGKTELYHRAKLALASLFSSETNIIQSEDTAQGTIVATVYSILPNFGPLGIATNSRVLYTVTLQVKNGKYRYVMDNLIHKCSISGYQSTTDEQAPLINAKVGARHKVQCQANDAIRAKIEDLKKAMENTGPVNAKKDW